MTANAALAASWSTILALGAAIGGLVTATIGSDAVFVIDAMSYVFSGSCLWAIRSSGKTVTARLSAGVGLARVRPSTIVMSAYGDLREGLRYLRAHPSVLRLSLGKSAWAIGGAALVYLLTQLGPRLTPADPALGIGILYSMRGLGTGIGPILSQRFVARRVWIPAIGLCVVLSGALYGVVGALGVSMLVVVPITLAHAASGANWVLSTVLLQEMVPDYVRGRVFAAELMVLMSIEALVVIGAAALLEGGVFSLTGAFVAFAALQLATGLAYMRWLRERPA
jgi:hypothetical protein